MLVLLHLLLLLFFLFVFLKTSNGSVTETWKHHVEHHPTCSHTPYANKKYTQVHVHCHIIHITKQSAIHDKLVVRSV